MMYISGIISGAFRCSYIYLISYGRYIYIGETGNHPVLRWGSHLSKNGSFINKLDRGNESLLTDDDIFFISVRCSEIECESIYKRKIARRAIEAELHRKYLLNPGVFGHESTLISNPPGDPVRHNFSFDPSDMAKKIYQNISDSYVDWLKNDCYNSEIRSSMD